MNEGNRSKALALGGFLAALIVIVVVALVVRGETGDEALAAGPDCSTETDISTDTSTKPEFEPPEGDPPEELECVDIVEGDGAVAKAGDQVTVQYVGIDYDSGKQFDASWDTGQPFPPFPLGSGSVIPGWDEGVEGMKVGGRRELIIPPDQAYGAQGQPPTIKPDATLVFVIDLLDVTPAADAAAAAGAAPTPTPTPAPTPTG